VTGARSGWRWSGLLAVAALIGVVVAAAGIFPFRQILAQERAVDLAREKLEAIEAENERLTREIVALQTPQEIERLAREQLGLVREGEIGYVVVSPPGVTDTTVPPEPTLDRPEEQPWWRDLWDFLTGRDLLDDG
jgi:cell division protein FtsB